MNTTGSDFALCTLLTALAVVVRVARLGKAAELHVPAACGSRPSASRFPVAGSGQATFYLVGPDHVVKRTVSLGSDLQIQSSDVRTAGRYQVILCGSSCNSATFEVKAAQPAHLSFFLHPSRVPVSMPDSIDATAFVFDQYFNLVSDPGDRGLPYHPGQRGRLLTGNFHAERCGLDAHGLDAT